MTLRGVGAAPGNASAVALTSHMKGTERRYTYRTGVVQQQRRVDTPLLELHSWELHDWELGILARPRPDTPVHQKSSNLEHHMEP